MPISPYQSPKKKPNSPTSRIESSPQNIKGENARVIIWKDQTFLLVNDIGKGWNLPGGLMEEKETPLECAIREVKEETNLVVKNLKELGIEWIESKSGWWKTYLYETDEFSGEVIHQTSEVSDIKFFTYQQAEKEMAEVAKQSLPNLLKSLKKRTN